MLHVGNLRLFVSRRHRHPSGRYNVYPRSYPKNAVHDFSVLIPVALPSSGPELLRVARLLAPAQNLRLTALHCRTGQQLGSGDFEDYEENVEGPLEPLLRAADDVHVHPISLESGNVDENILTVARERMADLILMGWHRAMVPDGEPVGPILGVLERAESDVAVFLARQFRPLRRVLVPFYGGKHDRRALELAARIARRTDQPVTVLHVVAPDRAGSSSGTGLSDVVEEFSDGRVRLKMVESDDPVDAAIREAWTGYDLIVAGASEVWGVDFSFFSERLQRLAFATPASLLVVHSQSQRGSYEPSSASKSEDESDRADFVESKS